MALFGFQEVYDVNVEQKEEEEEEWKKERHKKKNVGERKRIYGAPKDEIL